MDDSFKKNYLDMVESLKRSQRADIIDSNNESIIEHLYTDPFEGNSVISQMLNDQTTLLIGRKGTGKSTIINKFQHEIRKVEDKISLYIDVRTIFSKAANSSENIEQGNTLTEDQQTRLSLYKLFIKRIIEEIRIEINKSLFETDKTTWKSKILSIFSKSKNKLTVQEFEDKLNNLLETSMKDQYVDITAVQTAGISEKKSQDTSQSEEISTEGSISTLDAKVKAQDKIKIKDKTSNANELNYSAILKREFHISNFTDKLKDLLSSIGIKKAYICLDDSSELEKEALDVFIKTIVAPLHNDSEGYFRFKITFYPERHTLPDIDRQKIDTIYLDYFDLYRASGADKIEEQAISYVKRLLECRIKYYFDRDIKDIENDLFDTKNISIDEYYKLIFYICSNISRNIGRLLFYANKRSISQGKPITKLILQESALEQYINDIEPIIIKDEFFQYKSYDEVFGRSQLKRLVGILIEKSKENKRKIGESESAIFKEFSTSNAPSHFLFVKKGKIESYLSTLEINFFITRISEQKDKGEMVNGKFISNDIAVYTLNYGLCQKENVIFEETKDRKYRIERVFDFNKVIEEWAKNTVFVECKFCNHEYDISEWETIKEFEFFCKKCKKPNACQLRRRDINVEDNNIIDEKNNDLKAEHLRIIHSLYIEDGLTEGLIASELDVSPETVRAYLREDRKLRHDDWIKKDDLNRKYFITSKSKDELYGN